MQEGGVGVWVLDRAGDGGRVYGGVKVLAGDDHIRALPLLGAGGQLLAQRLL